MSATCYVSPKTGKEITRSYYYELIYKYNQKAITEDERFDLEICIDEFE